MVLSEDEVTRIAHLARLQIAASDAAAYARDLSEILAFVEQMNAVPTATVEPLAHTQESAQRLRTDHVTEADERAQFQALAPDSRKGLYVVPRVVDTD